MSMDEYRGYRVVETAPGSAFPLAIYAPLGHYIGGAWDERSARYLIDSHAER